MVGQPGFLAEVALLARDADLQTWRDYLRLRLLDAFAPALTQAHRTAHFAFYGQAQRGLKAPPERTEQLVDTMGGSVACRWRPCWARCLCRWPSRQKRPNALPCWWTTSRKPCAFACERCPG
ncbi:MAG: hypothetical protein ACOVN9_05925 [Inhella sp.]